MNKSKQKKTRILYYSININLQKMQNDLYRNQGEQWLPVDEIGVEEREG